VEPTVHLLESVWSSLTTLGHQIEATDPSLWRRPTDCPGWSVQDHFAHVIGTESMLLGRPTPGVEIGDPEHVRNDIGRANEQWVESFRARPGSEVLDALAEVTSARLDVLRAMTPQEWDAEGFTPEGPGPYRSFMDIRVFDCWFHEQDVREAIGEPGGLEGPVADHSIGRIAKGMPYVVGKKAGAPVGSTVVFHVEGERPFDVSVAVPERAVLLDAPPADPTVRLTLDRRTYARLAGGRRDRAWAERDGRLAIEGDEALGRTIADAMGYTI
jgi:uncharacterized protein (TIGR03083 family)